jgi:hypothetical protein
MNAIAEPTRNASRYPWMAELIASVRADKRMLDTDLLCKDAERRSNVLHRHARVSEGGGHEPLDQADESDLRLLAASSEWGDDRGAPTRSRTQLAKVEVLRRGIWGDSSWGPATSRLSRTGSR